MKDTSHTITRYSLEVLWGPGATWSNVSWNRSTKHKPTVLVQITISYGDTTDSKTTEASSSHNTDVLRQLWHMRSEHLDRQLVLGSRL